MPTRPESFCITPEELKKAIWCPVLEKMVVSTGSSVILESDDVSAQIKIVLGVRVWFKYKLRDRKFDGLGWKVTPLTDWTYGGADDEFKLGKAVEESIYCLDPRYPLSDQFTEKQATFIKNPFDELPYSNPTKENLDDWLKRWKEIMAFAEVPFPGYFCLKNIPSVRRHIHAGVIKLLRRKGYSYLTAVPTWWHTTNVCEFLGFIFQYNCDKESMKKLNDCLIPLVPFDKRKISWVVMLQFWAELAEKAGFISENFEISRDFILRDNYGKLITFPLSPQRNLWVVFKV